MKAQDLKNSILQMAMEGKLVPQDPNDEPASVFLERIKEEKEQLIKEKKIKRNNKESFIFRKNNQFFEKVGKKGEEVCIDDELPFDIPNSWEWVKLGSIVKISTGNKDANHGTDDGEYTFFTCSKDQIKSPTYSFEGECLLLPGNGANVGLVLYYDGKFEVYQRTYVLEKISSDFNMKFLKIAMDWNWKKYNYDKLFGSAIPYIKLGNLKEYMFPLPPLNEQKRIVKKINELTTNIKIYANYKNHLDKLNNEFPKKIKDSILQDAIQGKLVFQDPNDEPASVLLKRIIEEKEQLIKEKKIKRNKNESFIFKENNHFYEKIGKNDDKVCIDNEIPFDIPNNWEWCRLENIAFITKLAGFEYTKYISPNITTNGIPLLKAKYINGDKLLNEFEDYIPKELSDNLIRSKVNKKCILTPYVGASIGNVVFFEGLFEAHLAPNLAKIVMYGDISEKYVVNYIKSPFGYNELTKYMKSTAQPSISMAALRDMLIPLPPLNEQREIVKKIEELFGVLIILRSK